MALPAPHLDDRRFQQLVDEAKRFIQQRCPEWTDHNVSDPGVTLIEAFAHMTDQLLYRLNRVPEKSYLAFLDLLGVTLFPPVPARTDVTFWLSAPQQGVVLLPENTEVATVRTETEDALVFATTADLAVVPCSLAHLLTQSDGARAVDRTDDLADGRDVGCFQAQPVAGDALLVGLSDAVPHCAVVLRLDSRVEGVGVDPRRPPLVWEAFDGADWQPCEVEKDDTGGLNRPGEVILHVPGGHALAPLATRRAGWLRCRVETPRADQPFYSSSPVLHGATAFTIGGTVGAVHAELVTGERLGEAEGVPGGRFAVARPPVLPDEEPLVVEVAGEDGGWQEWTEVETFGASGPGDRHVRLDRTLGEVAFGPAVRDPDGSLRRCGAVPPKGAQVRIRRYRTGGGRPGNVAAHTLTVLRSSVPYVARTDNREAASGGRDGESVENAKLRGPIELSSQDRAVTARDIETLARRAAPAAARIRAVPAGDGAPAGAVRVLVVPQASPDGDRLRIEQLVPPDRMLDDIARYLDERRPIGARLMVEPPLYQGVTVVARITAEAGASAALVRARALDALHRHFDPLVGGPDGGGWPFGRPVQAGDAHAVLQAVPGVALVDDLRLFPADPLTGRRGSPADRIELGPHALVLSFEHQLLAEER
ncbi:putative baseplate assembly protein [Streptomyces sp. FL07-04A]|uniref:putative baseplate assembly protein n=1 Tax=Streptomyces sp. FL07-04A TaxID=3028658 RepID=UPI0029B49EF8|nr:putative baseplate assembly protein [Streptomyces sp. FL07-04A]MDX3575424.1 putative baseplate assembly protein [Streptomyces sp. FL07-04A]